MAGLTGSGVILAAWEAGAEAIGVDSDQDRMAPGTVLTSMSKRLDKAAHAKMKDIFLNRFRAGGNTYGLAQGCVRLSDMRFPRGRLPAGALDRLDDVKRALLSGELSAIEEPASIQGATP